MQQNIKDTKQSSKSLPIHIYLGGSFDPVHNSHLQLINHVYYTLATKNRSVKAYFLPTSRSPLKTKSSEAEHRLNMLAAAINELKSNTLSYPLADSVQPDCHRIENRLINNLFISEHEIWQTPPTYTIDTLSELRKQHPKTSLIFIIGADNVASLPRWRQGDKLTQFAHLWVIPRDKLQSYADIEALLPESLKSQVTVQLDDLKNRAHGHIYIDSHTVSPLSSTAIRTAIAEGELNIAKSALPHSVYSYIMKNNLYHSNRIAMTIDANQHPSKSQNAPMDNERLQLCLEMAQEALDDLKARNITVLHVAELTDVMDYMVIAEGTSKRHVNALADEVGAIAKKAGFMPLGREGEKDSDWTLVDLGGVVVHIMTRQAREFYDLEGLWSSPEELKKLVARDLSDR